MSVLATYATGLGAALVLVVAWLAVQGAWRRICPERLLDVDALAGRIGCFGCGPGDRCPRHEAGRPCSGREERT